jgi:hypothetical protein
MLTEHPYVRPARPKESVQNVRARAVIAAIAAKSGQRTMTNCLGIEKLARSIAPIIKNFP